MRPTGDDVPAPSFPATALVASQAPAASLPEGPLTEILSRLPYISLCRFKCVSKEWLALCSNCDILSRSPQTLSGFFHNHLSRTAGDLRFRNISGRGTAPPMVDPALPFLHGDGYSYERFTLCQCSGGLLLCQCWQPSADRDDYDLVVCNPATEEWEVMPPLDTSDLMMEPSTFLLGFDPADDPSRFVVFVPLVGCLDNVAIYSSDTGEWVRNVSSSTDDEERGDDEEALAVITAECVFLNGYMHLVAEDYIVAVDTEAEVYDRDRIPLPEGMEPSNGLTSMGHSQGLLHAWYIDPDECQLSVWVLKDCGTRRKWTLKHTIDDVYELFDTEASVRFYEVFAIHPERNVIFVTDGKEMTISYDMDNKEVRTMCTSGEFLGGLPYIPCFAEWLSDDDESDNDGSDDE